MDLDTQNTFINKVDIKGRFVYTKLRWKENDEDLFHIQIFDDSEESTWSGTFTNAQAENCMQSFEVEDINEYTRCVKLALTGNTNYVYDFITKDNPATKLFRWKRRYDDSVVEIHGSVLVCRDEIPESKNILIDFLLQENKELNFTIEKCNRNNKDINSELEKCKEELSKYVDLKLNLEETLYGKFVQLLNEKKKRIRLLEEKLKSC